MPKLTYVNVYIDLRMDLQERFKKIDCRTEIRMAQKNNVTTEVLSGKKDPVTVADCAHLLRQLLKRKLVPFPPLFQSMLENENYILMVAKKNGAIASFLLLNPENLAESPIKSLKTVRLELMATADEYKRLCPNYLLIWSAIEILKSKGFEALLWGFSHYKNAPDPEFDKVRFFKEKWHVDSFEVSYPVPWLKYIYFRYLRRFAIIKRLMYWSKIHLLKEELRAPTC